MITPAPPTRPMDPTSPIERLLRLGLAEAHLAEALERASEENRVLSVARIVRQDSGFGPAVAETVEGEETVWVPKRLSDGPRGALDRPVVGDWVTLIDKPIESARWSVSSRLSRRTELVRQAAGRRTEPQLLAVNVDVVAVVTAADADFNEARLLRYATAVRAAGAELAFVLSKADVVDDVATFDQRFGRVAPDAPVVVTSAVLGTGMDELRGLATSGRTIALVGSSGVGKSSLVNALLGSDRQAVREIRENDGKGRHCTTNRTLLALPRGGALLDTPGIRELALWLDPDDSLAFDDISKLSSSCRFRDCRHEGEPGCAVREAVDAGELDGWRIEQHHKLRREREWHEEKRGASAEHAARKKGKKLAKMVKEVTRYKRGR